MKVISVVQQHGYSGCLQIQVAFVLSSAGNGLQTNYELEHAMLQTEEFSVCKTDAKILIGVLPTPPHLAHHL